MKNFSRPFFFYFDLFLFLYVFFFNLSFVCRLKKQKNKFMCICLCDDQWIWIPDKKENNLKHSFCLFCLLFSRFCTFYITLRTCMCRYLRYMLFFLLLIETSLLCDHTIVLIECTEIKLKCLYTCVYIRKITNSFFWLLFII